MDVSVLKWIFVFVQIVLAIAAICTAYYIRIRLRPAALPPGFVDELNDLLHKRKFKDAFELARSEPSFVGRVLVGGMSRLQYGLDSAQKAASSTADMVQHEIKSVINFLPALAAMATLLGIVGSQAGLTRENSVALSTAIGMIASVCIAIPCAVGHVIFSNRLVSFDLEGRVVADDILVQMYHSSKKHAK
jgi:biopolymer transport protein ExbB